MALMQGLHCLFFGCACVFVLSLSYRIEKQITILHVCVKESTETVFFSFLKLFQGVCL